MIISKMLVAFDVICSTYSEWEKRACITYFMPYDFPWPENVFFSFFLILFCKFYIEVRKVLTFGYEMAITLPGKVKE